MCITVVGVKCEVKHFNRNILFFGERGYIWFFDAWMTSCYCFSQQFLSFTVKMSSVFFFLLLRVYRILHKCQGCLCMCRAHSSSVTHTSWGHLPPASFIFCHAGTRVKPPTLHLYSHYLFSQKSCMFSWSQPAALVCLWPPSMSTKDEAKKKSAVELNTWALLVLEACFCCWDGFDSQKRKLSTTG